MYIVADVDEEAGDEPESRSDLKDGAAIRSA
jgi:hypothetical protein